MIWMASSSDNSTPAHGPGLCVAATAASFRCPPSGSAGVAAQRTGPRMAGDGGGESCGNLAASAATTGSFGR
jgi:hypothetical protein